MQIKSVNRMDWIFSLFSVQSTYTSKRKRFIYANIWGIFRDHSQQVLYKESSKKSLYFTTISIFFEMLSASDARDSRDCRMSVSHRPFANQIWSESELFRVGRRHSTPVVVYLLYSQIAYSTFRIIILVLYINGINIS